MKPLLAIAALTALAGCTADLDRAFTERKRAHIEKGMTEREAEERVFEEMTGTGADDDDHIPGRGPLFR